MSKALLTKKASDQLDQIYLYSIKNFGQEKADIYCYGLLDYSEKLAISPGLGKESEIRKGVLYYPYGSHLIYYRIEEHGITIVSFLHSTQLPELHL